MTQLLTAGALEVITALTADQPPHAVLAGPASGNAAAPAFRVLTADDIPGLGNYQPLSANLTTLAATPHASFGLGLLSLANATAASTAILPAQGGNANKVLGTDGTTVAWQTPAAPAYPISVGNGGTGVATLTGNQILLGNGTGAVKSIANGNATQTIGFTGPGNTPQAMDFPGATSGSSTLSSGSANITSANGVYANVPLSGGGNLAVSVPGAGTYLFQVMSRGIIQTSVGAGNIFTRLYDATNNMVVPGTGAVVAQASQPGGVGSSDRTVCVPLLISTLGPTIYVLQMARDGATTYTFSLIASTSTIVYIKLF